MRVSLVIPSFYPAVVYGGPIFASLHAAEALAEAGIDVYVSTTDANGSTRLEIETGRFLPKSPGLWVKYYRETVVNRFSLAMLLRLWKDIADADLLHTQSIFSAPTPIALFYARLLKKPILLSPRGSLCSWCLRERSRFKKLWRSVLIDPFADHVVWHATSEQEKEDILTLYPKARVLLVPDGIHMHEFQNPNRFSRQAFAKKFGKSSLEPGKIIVSMGRLHKVKGFDILLEAFRLALSRDPDLALFIAGKDDGDLPRLRRFVKEYGIEGRVFFPGPLYGEDKRDFLANADLFALASHTENFGIVVAESLAAGTPVLVSDRTPWKEVSSAQCGLWVKNDPENFATAMLTLLSMDAAKLSENARTFVRPYDWSQIAARFKHHYEQLLERGNP